MNNINSAVQHEMVIVMPETKLDWTTVLVWSGVVASCSIFWYTLVQAVF